MRPGRSNSPVASFPARPRLVVKLDSVVLKPRYVVALACVCAALGLFTIHSDVLALIVIWRSDDLKSMGLVVPFVVAGLILREWRKLGWEFEGSWWGLALLVATSILVFIQSQTIF